MRLWGVVATLGLLIVVSLGLRTARGWAPTKREEWQIKCNRGELPTCTALGDDYLFGRTGAVDRERGIAILEDACTARAATACSILGFAYLYSGNANEKRSAERVLTLGCDLKSADACAYLGDLALHSGRKDNGIALLRSACKSESGAGCSLLGEQAFTSPDIRPEEATTAFQRACERDNEWACFRQAQALACGRGQKADPERAMAAIRNACATDGFREACEELVMRETDGGVVVSGKAHGRALIAVAFSQARRRDFDAARRTLAAFDGGMPFALAAVEVGADNLDAADSLLALAPKDQVEARVLREIARERRKGTRWPDAEWIGWQRAGTPDLGESEWSSPESWTQYPCSPPITAVESEAAFIHAVAVNRRSYLDEKFDAPVVKAAMRYSTSERLSVALLALSVLAEQAATGDSEAIAIFEKSARTSFAAKHSGTVLFETLSLPSDLRSGAASPDDFSRLVNLTRAPDERPLRELYDDYVRLLGPTPTSREEAFTALISAVSTIDVTELPAWLERGGHDASTRAAVLRDLGTIYVKRNWMVDRYLGASLLRASLALKDDEATRKLERETIEELKLLRTGPTGLSALQGLPFNGLDIERVIDDEMNELRRVHTLAVPP